MQTCTPLDLTRYQLHSNASTVSYTHSLNYSLTLLGLDVSRYQTLINGGNLKNPGHKFPLSSMKSLANRLRTNIRVRLEKDSKLVLKYYPSKRPFDNTVHLCLIEDHYFVDERVLNKGEITSSWHVMSDLYSSGQITYNPPEPSGEVIEVDLCRSMEEQSAYQHKSKECKTPKCIAYADIETIATPKHIPLMYGRYINGVYRSVSCGADTTWEGFAKFLGTFPDGKNVVYFHNLKYDWTIIKGNPHTQIKSILKKDGEYYSVKFTYYKKMFEIRDSYKYIPKRLSEFPKMFSLEGLHKHEFILYDLYTIENCSDTDYVLYRDLTPEDKPLHVYDLAYTGGVVTGVTKLDTSHTQTSKYILLDNRIAVEKGYLDVVSMYFARGRYYHIAHCEFYLHSDCEILYKGMEKYRETMLSLTGVDCHTKLTLPSIIHDKLCTDQCYDGVAVLTDNLRRFVSESVSGGRVVTKDNKMWDVSGVFHVLDGRSLYPSAIHRLCNPTPQDRGRTAGLPLGMARYITSWSKRDSFDHYIVRINVTAINKRQQIAFVNYLRGTREYTNDVSPELRGIVVDKITLEDWIEFQGIEYEFIEGVYWSNGGHTKIGDVVRTLYDERRKYIAEGNTPMSEICKLCLNSLYGKTIVKPNDVKLVVKNKKDVQNYLAEQFDNLIDMEECYNQSIISITHNDVDHSNMCHIGGLILSMARRIMNEVMNLATDLGIHIFYTDTDSMHILGNNPRGLDVLEAAYLERYSRVLVGSDLGQFSYELKYPGHSCIHSERIIVLGKKVYLHRVKGTNEDGTSEVYSHCRMKGVNTFAMSEYSDKLVLYERLYAGEVVPFDLTYGDGISFQFKETVVSREIFVKKISFHGVRGCIGDLDK